MITQIKETIESAIPNATAHVLDPMNDGQHFEAIVIAPSFTQLSLVKQHQQVMNALKEAFTSSVHALKLKTFSPEKWEVEKENYPFIKS